MKLKQTAQFIGSITLCLSIQANAAEHHAAVALEHSRMAVAHGQDGHADQLLKHAQTAEKEHAEAHAHMTEAVQHLKESIDHAQKGHVDVATQHAETAMVHMRESIDQ
ncbi:MAG: metal-binding protein SmbP [Methylomonas sp.]|nr:MAG: metal-binding protein SmbP [Methylomonas sp.]